VTSTSHPDLRWKIQSEIRKGVTKKEKSRQAHTFRPLESLLVWFQAASEQPVQFFIQLMPLVRTRAVSQTPSFKASEWYEDVSLPLTAP